MKEVASPPKLVDLIFELVKTEGNDASLGEKIRELINELSKAKK